MHIFHSFHLFSTILFSIGESMLVIGSDAVKMSDEDYISVSYTAVRAKSDIPQQRS
jgi:hypothetical protein